VDRSGKERRRVGGNSRRRSPRGLGPTASTPSPVRSYAAAVKEMSAADARPLSAIAGSASLLRDLWRALGLERRVLVHVCLGAPSRRLAG
jgi:hypothetical protein